MAVSRREALAISGSALFGLSVSGIAEAGQAGQAEHTPQERGA